MGRAVPLSEAFKCKWSAFINLEKVWVTNGYFGVGSTWANKQEWRWLVNNKASGKNVEFKKNCVVEFRCIVDLQRQWMRMIFLFKKLCECLGHIKESMIGEFVCFGLRKEKEMNYFTIFDKFINFICTKKIDLFYA